jgi:SAM-dependent methyltransferase
MVEINWAEQAEHLRHTAADEAGWNAMVAAFLVGTTTRVAVDVGCGGGGMAKALAEALPSTATVVAIDADPEVLEQARAHTKGAVRCELGSLDDGPEALGEVIGEPADLIWASASVHHAADQQAAVDALARLLAPGGLLALAEGGLPTRHLPWDLGIGEPGLELRLDAVQDKWFAVMRASLPGSVPMPYGWTEAIRRAGLTDVTTRTFLTERPVPLSDEERRRVVVQLGKRVDRLRPDGEAGEHLLPPEDLAIWDTLLDPESEHWLGLRTDLANLSARSIHLGRA